MIEEIKSKDDLIGATNEYAKLDRQRDQLAIELNAELDKVKNRFKSKAAALEGNHEALKLLIQAYVDEHKTELVSDDKRSFELPAAVIGYRRSTELVYSNSQSKAIIAALEKMGKHDCVAVKKSIDKSALEGWDTNALETIGVRREEKDTLYITVNAAGV